eukprot:7181518-Karenia_brevis.AAC.1
MEGSTANAFMSDRKRKLELLCSTAVSISNAAALNEDHQLATHVKDLLLITNTHTLFGQLLCYIPVPLEEGGAIYKLLVVSPFALLYIKCARHPAFDYALRTHVGARAARLIFYTDETTPRSQYRQDKAKETQALYWTILDMPR